MSTKNFLQVDPEAEPTRLGTSVIVPSRGGAFRLPVLLNALSQQNDQDFEVIVVVDGDIDGSAELLAGQEMRSLVPSLRVIDFGENRGRSAALNAGHDAAQGRVLIRCDDDLEPARDFIALHRAAHADGPAGAIGLYRNVLPNTPYAHAYGRDADRRHSASALASPVDIQWRYWAGNVSVTRDTWELIGPYDEGYRRYGWEDVDYGYRLHRAGIPVRIHPELTTDHHVAATTTAIRARRALHSGAARERFLQKFPEARPLMEGTPGRGPWNLAVRGLAAVSGENTYQRYGAVVDRLAKVLPTSVARKAIALGVEAAGRTGIQHPERIQGRF